MRKNFKVILFVLFLISFVFNLTILYSRIKKNKPIPFQQWPSCDFKNVKVLIAAHPYLANQGFAGTEEKEIENCIIIFPFVRKGTVFTNEDQGFGKVKSDVKIYFLDRNFRIIKSATIEKETGKIIAPEGTCMAIEGLP